MPLAFDVCRALQDEVVRLGFVDRAVCVGDPREARYRLDRDPASGEDSLLMHTPRLIMYHKQAMSARTRFLKLAYGGVCGFAALPERAELVDEHAAIPAKLMWHPASVIGQAERQLGLPCGSLEVDTAFRAQLRLADERLDVYLGRFTTIDPPDLAAAPAAGTFIDLTQARGLPTLELALLRRAYEAILG
jgi:hypothetical protein